MLRLSDIKMKPKLTILFLLVGIIPLAAAVWISYSKADEALRDAEQQAAASLEAQTFAQLEAVREIKRSAIERHFQKISNQIITFSEDQMVVDAMRQFKDFFRDFRADNEITDEMVERIRKELLTYYTNEFTIEYKKQNSGRAPNAEAAFEQLDDDSVALQAFYIEANVNPLGSKHLLDRADDDSRYSVLHGKVHPVIRSYLEKFGYYDIVLVDAETGDIVYSVFKEVDFSTSLIDGPYARTNFGKAFEKANASPYKDIVVLIDYAPYAPSYEAPASFIASSIFDGSKKIGVAIFQIPISRLNKIMSERSGMGRSGETYLVGPDNLMRSDSYLDPKNHSVVASFKNSRNGSVDTDATAAALAGKTGKEIIIDYNGNPVLSAYTPVDIGGTTWALLAEIDQAEAFAPIKKMEISSALATRALLIRIGLVVVISLIAIFAVALGVAGTIANPLGEMVRSSTKIAEGDIEQTMDYRSGDEIGVLADSFRKLIDYIKGLAGAAEALNRNDLSYEVTPQSERDVLSRNFVGISQSMHGLVDEMKSLITSARGGDLNQRGNTAGFEGVYAELIGGMNEMLDEVSNPINEAADVLLKVADGDLTARVEGEYQGEYSKIKDALNKAVKNLDQGLLQVDLAAEQVTSASGQINAGSQTLSQSTSELAGSLEEVASSLQEMSATTRQNTANAKEARSISESARESAGKGAESINQLSEAIDKIKTSSDKTAKIVKTINEIALQTNLLALNAAVEAAHAGESGKGFGVVAEEVRNLAIRSGEAAKDIAEMIQESVKNAADGVLINRVVLENLEEINKQINKVGEVMAEISVASEQQTQGIEEVNGAVEQMNSLTLQNAANAEESASAAEELASQAQEMTAMVNSFVLTDKGRQAAREKRSTVMSSTQVIQAATQNVQDILKDTANIEADGGDGA